jgi:hypothetical protein
MLECDVVKFAVADPENPGGAAKVMCRCKTHGVDFEPTSFGENDTCPMGYVADVERRVHHAIQDFQREMQSMKGLYARIAKLEIHCGLDTDETDEELT